MEVTYGYHIREINVAKDGKHLFATHPRSLNDVTSLKALWKLFNRKFPAADGYIVSASITSVTGYDFSSLADLIAHEKAEARKVLED